jgi:hypothetical protein
VYACSLRDSKRGWGGGGREGKGVNVHPHIYTHYKPPTHTNKHTHTPAFNDFGVLESFIEGQPHTHTHLRSTALVSWRVSLREVLRSCSSSADRRSSPAREPSSFFSCANFSSAAPTESEEASKIC